MSHVPDGRPQRRPVPRLHKLTARLHPTDYDRLKAIADRHGIPIETLATQALIDFTHRADRAGAAGPTEPSS